MEGMRKHLVRGRFGIFLWVLAVREGRSKQGGSVRRFGKGWKEEWAYCARKKQQGESLPNCWIDRCWAELKFLRGLALEAWTRWLAPYSSARVFKTRKGWVSKEDGFDYRSAYEAKARLYCYSCSILYFLVSDSLRNLATSSRKATQVTLNLRTSFCWWGSLAIGCWLYQVASVLRITEGLNTNTNRTWISQRLGSEQGLALSCKQRLDWNAQCLSDLMSFDGSSK